MDAPHARFDRYTRVAIAFHWSVAALIVINLTLGLAHDALPSGWRIMPVHKAIGITILALSIGRLFWRWTHRAPDLPDAMPEWEKKTAKLTHAVIYALTLLIPLTGWIMVSGAQTRRPLDWFGLFDLPYLPVRPGTLAAVSHTGHQWLAFLLISLLILHVAAALRHHLVLRDRVLARMLPLVDR